MLAYTSLQLRSAVFMHDAVLYTEDSEDSGPQWWNEQHPLQPNSSSAKSHSVTVRGVISYFYSLQPFKHHQTKAKDTVLPLWSYHAHNSSDQSDKITRFLLRVQCLYLYCSFWNISLAEELPAVWFRHERANKLSQSSRHQTFCCAMYVTGNNDLNQIQ